jgi:hypothetical protein
MRARLFLPGIVVVAFAATLAVIGWPDRGPTHRDDMQLQTQVSASVAPTPTPTPTSVPESTVIVAAPDAAPAVEASQPPLPEPSALPSYRDDQADRNRDAVRSARTR